MFSALKKYERLIKDTLRIGRCLQCDVLSISVTQRETFHLQRQKPLLQCATIFIQYEVTSH